MSFVLFVLGLIAVAAGVLTIGFGIPINEFSLGNTLIIAGATVLSGGLVVVALAITNRQLKKITEILMTRPVGPASARAPEHLEPSHGGRSAGPRLGAGPEIAGRAPSYPERPHQNAPQPEEMSDEDDFDQPRPGRPAGAPRHSGQLPGFDPIEDVPVSPRTQPRIPMGAGAPPPSGEAGQRGWRPPGARPAAPPAEPVRHEPTIRAPERPQRPAPEVSFESIWPADRRPERIEPEPDLSPEPSPAPAPRPNGEAVHHREGPLARPAPEPARSAPPADNAPVSVLKSGVVDGMAYTLYTDGSIEAELAQGVVRFGSIEELRNHLEKGA